MADGTSKPIEDLQVGDRVLSYDERGFATAQGEIVQVHPPYSVDHYYRINGKLRITEFHPVLSGNKWVAVGTLKVGDTMKTPSGLETTVASVERIDQAVHVYNVQVSTSTYVADGIVVHNKEDCLQYEQRYRQ